MKPRHFTETSHSQRFPVEIWKTIFEGLTSRRNLYNVAITSRYIHNIVTPILYRQLSIGSNRYLTYTLSLLRRNPALARRITSLTLLSPTSRTIRTVPTCVREESTKPLLHPIFPLFPLFTTLSTLYILNHCIPADFLLWICELPQLTTLEIRNSMVSSDLKRKDSPTPLPLQTLTLVGCRESKKHLGTYMPGQVCKDLLNNAPFLTSLTIDWFVERVAWCILSNMTRPPPIKALSCHGLDPADLNGSLFCGSLMNLPTITSLHVVRMPLALLLFPFQDSLPQLQDLTGEVKSFDIFFGVHCPLRYLTIIDYGRTPPESRLIYFLESVRVHKPSIKSFAFKLTTWSEEVFLCICQLWPDLKELRIQCMSGPGVDEYFRISFGPRFLPQLRHLEVLHIYQRPPQLRFERNCISKGVPAISHYPNILSPEEAEELQEAPYHYRRWEKLCPSLREIAFDREFGWRRALTEPRGWVLMRDITPAPSLEVFEFLPRRIA